MSISILWSVALLALFCEYVDSTLGMGYGTTLTPVLLLMGYEPTQVVPSVLLSEFMAGIMAGAFHQGFGNVSFRRGSRPLKVALVLAACSIVGTIAAVFVTVSLPEWILRTYIGVLVLVMGGTILLTLNRAFVFSWKKVVGLGLMAALNKGLSGGGYGPVVCSGQVLTGIGEKEAVSITSLAEGLVCIVGVIAYLLTGNGALDWEITPSLVLGALFSVPLATFTVKRLSLRKLRWAIGSAVTALGLYTLSSLANY